ncbi:MAG: phosphoribosylglycinamide formyltransferase [Alistipes sp.]
MKKIALFASGNGSNFEALVVACQRGEIPAEAVLLVCDQPDAPVVARAHRLGVACFCFSPKTYASKADYEQQIVQQLDQRNVDLICLAGYMRILSSVLLTAYAGRILNIHPSLLPAFKGAHAIRDAFEYGVRVFGVTIHEVDASLDGGRIVAQHSFPYEGNDLAELERQIHALEHPLYIETVKKWLSKLK